MNGDKPQQVKMLRIAHKIVPGLNTFIRYERSWLRSDLGAGLSVAIPNDIWRLC